MKVICPECSAHYMLDEDLFGRKIACSKCDNRFYIADEYLAEGTIVQSEAEDSEELLDTREGATDDRYEIKEEIARGGIGAIMRTRDKNLKRDVAMKVITSKRSKAMLNGFVNEAQITGRLEHPNIVPVHEMGVNENGTPFFTMKLVKGEDLGQLIDELRSKEKTQSHSSLITMMVSVCNAMAFAHAKGVVHCDLKPANVMLGDFGEVLVMDWGAAKQIRSKRKNGHHDETSSGAVMGTPAYMAPEQARGDYQAIDRRSDIYSLGAILYELLTYKRAMRKKKAAEILKEVLHGKIVPPHERVKNIHVPSELSAIVMKAMEKDPEDRYQTATELREDLELFLEGRAVSAKEDNFVEMMQKAFNRNRGAAYGICGVFAALVLGFFVAVVAWGQAEKALDVAEEQRKRAQVAQEEAEAARADVQEALRVARSEKSKAEVAKVKTEAALASVQAERKKVAAAGKSTRQALKRFEAEKAKRRKDRISSAPVYLDEALKFVATQNFKEALLSVDKALAFDGHLAAAHMLKAQISIHNKKFPAAIKSLKAYLKLKPKDKDGVELLAIINSVAKMKTDALADRLAAVFMRQKAHAFVSSVELSLDDRLAVWQGRIEQVWPGQGEALTATEQGGWILDLTDVAGVEDLSVLVGSPVTDLRLSGTGVKKLAALKNLPLERLDLSYTAVNNIAALSGKKIETLSLAKTAVKDLKPLKGMPLRTLDLAGVPAKSFAVLGGLPLLSLSVAGTSINSLDEINTKNLRTLNIAHTSITDLSKLKNASLKRLDITGNVALSDLIPIKKHRLSHLYMAGAGVDEIKTIQRMRLQELTLSPLSFGKAITKLKTMSSLKKIGSHQDQNLMVDADEFWKGLKDMGKGLTAAQMHLALAQDNPGYVNQGVFKVKRGMVVEASFDGRVQLKNIRGLAGAKLTKLFIRSWNANPKGFAALKDMELTELVVNNAMEFSDLSVLQGQPLQKLTLHKALKVRDLKPLRKMPLVRLTIEGSKELQSISALKGLPIVDLDLSRCSNITFKHFLVFRTLPKLKNLGVAGMPQLKDLRVLKGLRLGSLDIGFNPQIENVDNLPEIVTGYISFTGNSNLTSVQALTKWQQPPRAFSFDFCTKLDLSPLPALRPDYLRLAFCSTKNLKPILRECKNLNTGNAPWLEFLATGLSENNFIAKFEGKQWMLNQSQRWAYRAMKAEMNGKTERAKKIYARLIKSREDGGEVTRCSKERIARL